MLHKLRVTSKFDANRILRVEAHTRGNRPEGMLELFAELAQLGHCESYNAGRIYYLAYLLSKNYSELKFEIVKEG